ncbi:MAG: type II secretion system protein [Phycisphaerales bacterium]
MRRNHSRGFTLWELLAVLAIVVLFGAILLPLISQPTCRNSKNVVAQANLRSLNTGTANYAGDNGELIFWFTRIDDGKYSSLAKPNDFYPRLDPAGQAQDILQRATGRIQGKDAVRLPIPELIRMRYSHLVLLDYLTDRQPEPIVASPFDKNLIDWQQNPLGYLDEDSDFPYGGGMPSVAGYDTDPMWLKESVKQLWPFGSSYQVVPHAWVNDVDPQYTPSSDSPHHMVKGESEAPLGGRKMSEVAFPSAKVFMYEEFDRLSDPKGIYAAYPEAKINLAFFDGSVRSELVGKANSAFDADHPDRVWEQAYVPLDTFPVPMGGHGDLTKLDLRFRWTKGGLAGIDYK